MNFRLTTMTVLWGGCALLAAQSGPPIKKTTVTATSPASGKEMYLHYCASCHGKEGKGDGPAAVALKVPPKNLATMAARNGGKFPDFRVAGAIEGSDKVAAHGSRDMPIWGEVFNGMDPGGAATAKLRIGNLTEYIKSIQVR